MHQTLPWVGTGASNLVKVKGDEEGWKPSGWDSHHV